MSASASPRTGVRAGIPRRAVEIVAGRAPDAEILVMEDLDGFDGLDFLVPVPRRQRDLVDALPGLARLSVIQTLSAGVDALQDVVPDHVTLCSARGTRDEPVAEWIVGALLGTTTHLLECAGARRWHEGMHNGDLSEWSVLIVGMGSIGERVGGLLAPFGTDVVPVVSHARDDMHGVDELDALLPEADAVVVLAPLTEDTEGLIDARALRLMKDGALLVNAARGSVVDTDALVAETASGRLRAVLDVTDPEPLPDGHPLWSAEGVLSITPHIGGDSPRGNQRAAEFAGDQLARFCTGKPLHNIVHQGEGP